MSAQSSTSRVSDASAHTRRARSVVAIVIVSVLTTAAVYTTFRTDAPEPRPAPTTSVAARSEQVMDELRESVIGLYGPGTAATASPSPQVMRELRETVIGLYGPGAAATVSPSPEVMRDLRETVIGLYGRSH